MKPHHCCPISTSHVKKRQPSPLRRIGGALEWIVPGVIVIALPKCPACVAAYIALATGVGISFSTAAHLRAIAMAVSVASLVFLAIKRILRIREARLPDPRGTPVE